MSKASRCGVSCAIAAATRNSANAAKRLRRMATASWRWHSLGLASANPLYGRGLIRFARNDAAQQIGDAPLLKVMGPVVDQMTTLTEASQILETVVARIVIEVGSGQNDAGLACASCFFDIRPAGRAAAVIAPDLTGVI